MVELLTDRPPSRAATSTALDPAPADARRPHPTSADAARSSPAQPEPGSGSGSRTVEKDPFLVGWGALWTAIALNVSQVFVLDGSEGLRQPALLPLVVVGFLAELALFARAVRCLSPVVAYAAYGSTPAVVTVLSVGFFGEALTVPKVAGIALVTAGIILLTTATTAAGDTSAPGDAAASDSAAGNGNGNGGMVTGSAPADGAGAETGASTDRRGRVRVPRAGCPKLT